MTVHLRGPATHGRTPPGTPTIEQRWQAAKAAGLRTFDPGVECIHGHRAFRWTNNGICVECKRARDNAYNAKHKKEHRARSKRSVEKRRDQVLAYRRAWGKRNTGKIRAANAAREAKQRGARTGDRKAYATFVQWARDTERVCCYWCRRSIPRGVRQLDHIVPISRGGHDSVGNLCVSCRPCNRSKSAKMPEEFSGQSELHLA